MKKLFTLAVMALAAVSVTAQEKSWTFEDWETKDYTEETTKDGLTVHASSSGNVTIEDKNNTFEVNGMEVSYTKRLNLKGVAKSDSRYFSFSVDGPCEITIVCNGATSTTTNRVLNISYGDTYDMANLISIVIPPCGEITAGTVKYERNDATTIYVGSGNSGVYILGIYVKSIELDNPDASTYKLYWDFSQPISDTDKENIETDTETWSSNDNNLYTHLPFYEADAVVDNLYGITLSANGKEIEWVKGLRFGRPNGAIKGTGETNDRFSLYGSKYLQIKGTDIGFVIPDLKRNDEVKIVFSTGSSSESTLKLTNAVVTEGNLTSSSNKEQNTVICKVLSDGYVGFRGTNSMRYYSLSVNENLLPTAYYLTTEDTRYYSLYLNYDAIIPEGITAYTAALSEDGNTVELTKVMGTVLKRNRGYIVKGNAKGTFTFAVSDIMGDETAGNELKGVTVDTDAADIEAANEGKTVVTLGLKDGVMGFRKPADGKIEANKAYLLTDTPLSPNSVIGIRDDGNTTGIGTVAALGSDDNAPAFNLAGQRVGSGFKGIVLRNGKKVIRK